jgi:hypothetical protein
LQSGAEVVSDSDSEDAIEDCCEDEDSSMSDSDSGYGTEGFARRQSAASSRSRMWDQRQSTASSRSWKKDRRPSFNGRSIS